MTTVPSTPPAERRRRAAVAAAVALYVALQALAVLNPSVAELDPEEMYNAGHAWALADGHWRALWRLQYREFCGGCTGSALLGAPLFAILPPSWMVWKLVPIGLGALLTAVGTATLWRRGGSAAGLTFAGLMLLSPRAWLQLSLIAWGNHVEVGIFGVVALALLASRRALWAGVVTGIALWWSFSAAYLVLGLPLVLALSRRPGDLARFLAGLPLGLLPWLLRWLDTGLHPFVTIYEPGEATPRLARVPQKLWSLLAPRQLVALFGLPQTVFGIGLGWGVGWAFAAGVALAGGAVARWGGWFSRAALALVGVWVGIYLLVRFSLWEAPAPLISGPGGIRYAAPLYPLLFVLVAAAVGSAWTARRGLAWAILALTVPAGVAARAEALASPFPRVALLQRVPVAWFQFSPQFSYTLTPEEHADCGRAGPVLRRVHHEALGWHAAKPLLQSGASLRELPLPPDVEPDAFAVGVAEAVFSEVGPGDPPRLDALARGAALLGALPVGTAAYDAGLQHLAWLFVQEERAWLPSDVPLDGAALDAMSTAVAAAPTPVRAAAFHAAGRAWGQAVTGDAVPTAIFVPDQPLPGAFWEGLGRAAGEAWGPVDAAPRPGGAVSEADFAAGYAVGLECCWLPPHRTPSLTRP